MPKLEDKVSTDDLQKGDKVKIRQDSDGMMYGHEKYAGCILTIKRVVERNERVSIKEFENNSNVGLEWIPINFVEKKLPNIPDEMFEIE